MTQPLRPHLQLAILALMLSLYIASSGVAERPNFVPFVADELGYGDLGCYGSTTNATPHIDAQAAACVRFTYFRQYQQRFGAKFDGALSGQHDRDDGSQSPATPQGARPFGDLQR